jgi:hypothetical protein
MYCLSSSSSCFELTPYFGSNHVTFKLDITAFAHACFEFSDLPAQHAAFFVQRMSDDSRVRVATTASPANKYLIDANSDIIVTPASTDQADVD